MHWVNRGPEPDRLAPIRVRQTPHWVQCYEQSVGDPPTYHGWRSFRADLKIVFHGLCAYCEQIDPGEVDHFRPKSVFPREVYVWDNWVFSCHPCNHAKGEKWPDAGYIDPCAPNVDDRPESYFDFSTQKGRIEPKLGLSSTQEDRAKRMIKDLKLNEWYQVEERKTWVSALDILPDPLSPSILAKVQAVAVRSKPLSSLTRAWLTERGNPAYQAATGCSPV